MDDNYIFHQTSRSLANRILKEGLKAGVDSRENTVGNAYNKDTKNRERNSLFIKAEQILEETRPKYYPKRGSVNYFFLEPLPNGYITSPLVDNLVVLRVDIEKIKNYTCYVGDFDVQGFELKAAIDEGEPTDYSAKEMAEYYWERVEKHDKISEVLQYQRGNYFEIPEVMIRSDIPAEAIELVGEVVDGVLKEK